MITTQAGFGLESFEYELDSETCRFEYDRNTTSTSMAVVAALSEVTGTDPMDLEPLHTSVDTDALDALVGGRSQSKGSTTVTFTAGRHAVTVFSDGVVEIVPAIRVRDDGASKTAPE